MKTAVRGFRLIPDTGGKFELTVDGELVYSKLATGEFPEPADIAAQLAKKAGVS